MKRLIKKAPRNKNLDKKAPWNKNVDKKSEFEFMIFEFEFAF